MRGGCERRLPRNVKPLHRKRRHPRHQRAHLLRALLGVHEDVRMFGRGRFHLWGTGDGGLHRDGRNLRSDRCRGRLHRGETHLPLCGDARRRGRRLRGGGQTARRYRDGVGLRGGEGRRGVHVGKFGVSQNGSRKARHVPGNGISVPLRRGCGRRSGRLCGIGRGSRLPGDGHAVPRYGRRGKLHDDDENLRLCRKTDGRNGGRSLRDGRLFGGRLSAAGG